MHNRIPAWFVRFATSHKPFLWFFLYQPSCSGEENFTEMLFLFPHLPKHKKYVKIFKKRMQLITIARRFYVPSLWPWYRTVHRHKKYCIPWGICQQRIYLSVMFIICQNLKTKEVCWHIAKWTPGDTYSAISVTVLYIRASVLSFKISIILHKKQRQLNQSLMKR